MDGKKVYQIQINGISESVSAIESLNKQLDALEKRIKELGSKNIKIDGGSVDNSAIKEQVAKQKELNQLKKEEAAQQRLIADEYENTMKGMKQNLADLKTVINATDLGDSDSINKMTKDANELTNKLKAMEQAYGQFGRNVGNYRDAANGFKALAIQVGDTTKEFDNAKQALKELKKERDTLAVKKDMGLISEEEAKRLQDLIPTVAQLQSSIQDAGKPMDSLLDSMQSFVAVMQSTKGISAFFGIDNAEVEKTIKNLVALQNAMQGLQTIQKQIQTREGIGAWIAPFTVQIDKATTRLLAFNTALLGTGKAASVASKGIKMLGTAMKALISIGIVAVISIIAEKVMDLIESFNKLSAAEEAQKEAEEAMSKAYGEGMAKLVQYKAKLDSFNGSKKEEKKLVEELNKEFGTTLGTYKSIAEWQDVMKKKGDAYIKTLQLQAKAQAIVNSLTAAYAKLQQIEYSKASGEYDTFLNNMMNLVGLGKVYEKDKKETDEFINYLTSQFQNIEGQIEQHNKNNQLGDYAPQIEKNTAKSKNALEDSQRTLNQLELRLMQDGLNKKLRQLDEEERQTINKLKENGRKSAIEIQKIQRAYAALRAREIQEYLKNLEASIKQSADNIKKIQFEIDTKDIDNEIDELQNKLDKMYEETPRINTLSSNQDLRNIYSTTTVEKVLDARFYIPMKNSAEQFGVYDTYFAHLKEYLDGKNEEIKQEFLNLQLTEGEKAAFDWLAELYEEEYREALNIVRSYGDDIMILFKEQLNGENDWLSWSFNTRLEKTREYLDNVLMEMADSYEKQGKLNVKRIEEQYKQDWDAEVERYRLQYNELEKRKELLDDEIENFKAKNDKEVKLLEELKEKRAKIEKQIEIALIQHGERQEQITAAKNNAIKKNEIDTQNEIKSSYERYFNIQLSNYRDFQSKLNDEVNKNPVADKNWGIVNIKQTKKNYKEIIEASKYALKAIQDDKANLEDAMRNGLISKEAYNSTKNSLNDLEKEIKNGMAVTEEASANLIADFIASTQMYLQAAMDSFSTIMNAVWDAQDIAFDKEQEQLDKENELLDKKLDEQQQIIEQHKSAIESIEDELATSRGDRRQHLIDQLNAEMEAQRAAAAEEKRIQKEKEAMEKKQEALELKRKKAEYKRDMLQAVVNGAMAVTMAAINKWPIPAIPMMALAASTTAAQIAIMAANKPYRFGGQLESGLVKGKRHTQGGVPVGNTGIEVEGDEYVIRRESTIPNVDLLDYINKSRKRLNLDDFIDYYSSGKIKKSIMSMSPRTKFESGGQLPTLNYDLNINDRLIDSFERYASKPSVVQVVDIINKTDDINRVKVLAGLTD